MLVMTGCMAASEIRRDQYIRADGWLGWCRVIEPIRLEAPARLAVIVEDREGRRHALACRPDTEFMVAREEID